MSFSILHRFYMIASRFTGPGFAFWQRRALANGKEDPDRVAERWGHPGRERPEGRLVWFHAASVGETQSILPLIERLLATVPDVQVMVTSTTRSSARMLANDLPPRAFHQVAPYDTKRVCRRFLQHWQPNVAVWVESELWPRMLYEVARRDVPMLLLNARVSARTADRWRRFAATARVLLAPFRQIHVQEETTLNAMRSIGVDGDRVRLTGALKQDRPPLSCDPEALAHLRAVIGTRPVWCAASTHAGEEEVVLEAHARIGGLLVLVPRHAERAEEVAAMVQGRGLNLAQRSKGEEPDANTDVYLADTMGEMGLWFRLAPVSFIGGSLERVGGHNPYEPAQLDSAMLFGPHVYNFQEIYAALEAEGGAIPVSGAEDLAEGVQRLLAGDHRAVARSASTVVRRSQGATEAALAAILEQLAY
jgi:3-deoxy-D-manno-octulosonic-acid transferase